MSKWFLYARLKPQAGWKELAAAFFPAKGAVSRFESQFAEKFDCTHGIMFAHGRSGLYALLKAWQLTDAEILCPAYTCVVVPHAIVLSGNTPVFVDAAEDSFNMDYQLMEEKISEKTRAIVVTHLFGYPMDVERIERMAKNAEKKYGQKIYVIQDVAHSFGAKWNGQMVTTFGDAAIFGLNISKIMTSIFGGMVLTKEQHTSNRLREIRNTMHRRSFSRSLRMKIYLLATYFAFNKWIYALVNWLERHRMLDRFVRYYDETRIDFPADWDHQPTDTEAAVGLVQLTKYDQIVQARTANSRAIIQHFSEDRSISFMTDSDGATYSHCVALVEDRKKWVDDFHSRGIQLGILIEYSVPEMTSYKEFGAGDFPRARYYSNHTINFPIWMGMRSNLIITEPYD